MCTTLRVIRSACICVRILCRPQTATAITHCAYICFLSLARSFTSIIIQQQIFHHNDISIFITPAEWILTAAAMKSVTVVIQIFCIHFGKLTSATVANVDSVNGLFVQHMSCTFIALPHCTLDMHYSALYTSIHAVE